MIINNNNSNNIKGKKEIKKKHHIHTHAEQKHKYTDRKIYLSY